MKKDAILLFGGTSEGRMLCEELISRGLRPYVSVATEYGETLLPDAGVQVICGRMEQAEICSFLHAHSVQLVVDATHPYAVQITENVRAACLKTRTAYLRLAREPEPVPPGAAVQYAKNAADAAEQATRQAGNIFLATGVKELPTFVRYLEPERLIVRALPSPESLGCCLSAGVLSRNIVCMQGPFTREINAALFRHFHICVLVTKESGRAGGFVEKLEAARDAGIGTIVIRRPSDATGLPLAQILRQIDASIER